MCCYLPSTRPMDGLVCIVDRRSCSVLRDIIAVADAAPVTTPVGVLTGIHRDNWASAFPALIGAKDGTSAQNIGTIRAIASSMFALCLDDAPATTHLQVASAGAGTTASSCLVHARAFWLSGTSLAEARVCLCVS